MGVLYFGNRVDKDLSYKLMDRYVEAGGTLLDTANIYAFWVPGFQGGESETVLPIRLDISQPNILDQ